MTEPPIKIAFRGQCHAGVPAPEPSRRVYRQTARRVAFAALTGGALASQLVHAFQSSPEGGQVVGAWLVADAAGIVTAHPGQGAGGPWDLADAILPGSSGAVQRPVLNGFYRDRPDAYRELVGRG